MPMPSGVTEFLPERTILEMMYLPSESCLADMTKLGNNARAYFEKNFHKEKLMQQMDKYIEDSIQ